MLTLFVLLLDYSFDFVSITFLAGRNLVANVQCIPVLITNDTILEENEVFVLSLNTTDEDVILSPNSSVTIIDDDGNCSLNFYCA